jgi:hypothetical protein
VPAVCGRDVTEARRPKPAKIEPVVTSKCVSGRPLLTGSAPQTEFLATHSKQTTEKFLTGARTHIRIFNFSPFATQDLSQLIQRRRHQTNPKRSNDNASRRISNRKLAMRRASPSRASALRRTTRGICSALSNRELNLLEPSPTRRKQTIKPNLTETRITHVASRNRISTRLVLSDFRERFVRQKRISNRFWVKNRSHRKQTSKPCLTGSRFVCLAQRASRCSVLWARRGRDTIDVQTITRLSPGRSPL